VSSQFYALSNLSGGKKIPLSIEQVDGNVPKLVGVFFGEKDLYSLLGIEPQIVKPVALSLYYLSYPICDYIVMLLTSRTIS
jgi:hypothetical protein